MYKPRDLLISGVLCIGIEATVFCVVNHYFGGAALIVVAILCTTMGYAGWCESDNQLHRAVDALMQGYLTSPFLCDFLSDIPYVADRQKRIKGKTLYRNRVVGIVVLAAYSALFCAVSHFFNGTALIVVATLAQAQAFSAWCGCNIRMQSTISGLQYEMARSEPDFNAIVACLRQI